MNCLQRRTPAGCKALKLNHDCSTCGWNVHEAQRRRDYLREHGLTLCEDGLYRLVMKKGEQKDAQETD